MQPINRLFVAHKPPFLSSNKFLNILRFRYGNIPRAGFSGTLDPFAKGCLIVAFGQYTKLFNYLAKTPKTYRATIWLGANSDTLDLEGVNGVDEVSRLSADLIRSTLEEFKGEQHQIPPKFSALRVGGTRAYKLARDGADFELKSRKITVHSIELLNYSHPFLSFECSVSEGTYIRTLGSDIANRLGCKGALSSLTRVSEGAFSYQNEKPLDPFKYLNIGQNFTTKTAYELSYGAKLELSDLTIQKDGTYYIDAGEFFVIIEINGATVSYKHGAIVKGK